MESLHPLECSLLEITATTRHLLEAVGRPTVLTTQLIFYDRATELDKCMLMLRRVPDGYIPRDQLVKLRQRVHAVIELWQKSWDDDLLSELTRIIDDIEKWFRPFNPTITQLLP